MSPSKGDDAHNDLFSDDDDGPLVNFMEKVEAGFGAQDEVTDEDLAQFMDGFEKEQQTVKEVDETKLCSEVNMVR